MDSMSQAKPIMCHSTSKLQPPTLQRAATSSRADAGGFKFNLKLRLEWTRSLAKTEVW
jgi:hypothetical protein